MGRRKARPGEASRAPLEHPVGLRFKHLGDFVSELAANVSTGGMFIRTARPYPVGSIFEFELRPGSDGQHIAGKAQVAWVRRRGEGADRPAGMGVRFVELDDPSRRHIAELVALHQEAGGQPVEPSPPADEAGTVTAADEAAEPSPDGDEAAGRPPAAAPEPGSGAPARAGRRPATAGSPAPLPPTGRAAAAASADRRPGRLWVLLAILLALPLAFVLWRQTPADPPAAADPTPPAPAEAAPAAAPDGPSEPAETGDEPRKPDQVRAVEAWALAWTEQRVEDYLAAYSPRFVPDGGLDRATWARQRRARLLAPQSIHVGLAFVELEEIGPDSSRVRFVQAYESDSYRDVVRKVLELQRGPDGWKIVRETVEP